MTATAAPGTLAGRRASGRPRVAVGLAACAVLAAVAFIGALAIGPVSIGPGRVLAILAQAFDAPMEEAGRALRERMVVLDIRLPRAVLGLLTGAGTAMAGAVMQGVFRNPLADPGLVGVSPGAALAAVAFIVLGMPLFAVLPDVIQPLGLPLAAFAGSLVTTMLIARLAMRGGSMSVATLLFAGLALGALASAGTGLLVFISTEQQSREFVFWTLGSLGGATWPKVALVAPFVTALLVGAPFLARGLDALALGEAEAFHVGVPVERLKRWSIIAVAAGVGACVAAAGVVGFVGLIVPHLVRMWLGPGHRVLLPASALLGAAVLLAADICARMLAAPAELPLGVVTALVGAPFFLWLLLRRRLIG
ncbi:hemin ABC transporter permease [Azorhizobium oxalatiphilum]|uniref:Hemin ABC transporter permease n=1 Tax=Azorhizobium oxalatiphilum TaxID=980631 RepID=A0A917FFW3_9HYPH|nr:iron ABC transporter permease [Azorhizobium oxalatiphilum]GGF77758.1 hemin ABC transporter permease [Azorhizobium oxalatiphilum]